MSDFFYKLGRTTIYDEEYFSPVEKVSPPKIPQGRGLLQKGYFRMETN